MNEMVLVFPFLISGLLAVTAIDTLGAYTSRRMNFNYGYLAIFSFVVYGFIGYTVSKHFSLNLAFVTNLLIAFYDATIGWKLSRWCGANTGMTDEELANFKVSTTLSVMLFVSLLFTFIGYLFV